jgi:hypothetical protein
MVQKKKDFPPKFEDQHQEDAFEQDFEQDIEVDREKIVDFLRYPKNKRMLTEYLEDTYKKFEREEVERTIAKQQYEYDSEMQGATDYHKPGHIGSLMYQYLNMVGVESAYVSGLQHTKASMTKTVQQKVDEINTLLRGVGGFNRQIKSSFSRSASLYLEQEDPRAPHRERVIFTVNIADFELKHPLDESGEHELTEDGRSLRRLVWDEAFNTVSEIISNTGLKPKYVRNNKNDCSLEMRQYLIKRSDKLPDEYFEFDLKHVNEAKRQEMEVEYAQKIEDFEANLADCEERLNKRWISKRERKSIENEMDIIQADYELFLATTPNPSQMDTGLIFSIYVNTLKDYSVTKDKMQVIMTKFILALSSIAVDKSLDEQINRDFKGGKPSELSDQEKEQRIVKKVA